MKSGHDNASKHASAACRQGQTFVGRKGEKIKENKEKIDKKIGKK